MSPSELATSTPTPRNGCRPSQEIQAHPYSRRRPTAHEAVRLLEVGLAKAGESRDARAAYRRADNPSRRDRGRIRPSRAEERRGRSLRARCPFEVVRELGLPGGSSTKWPLSRRDRPAFARCGQEPASEKGFRLQ